MTRFICQELLFDYVTDRLDQERRTAVEEYVKGCRDSQRELDRLRKGLRFTAQGSQVRVSPELKSALLEFEPQWKKTLDSWTLWSSQRGWKILPYVLIVLVMGLSLQVMKPWQSSSRPDVLLVEQVKKEPDIVSPPADIKIQAPQITPLVDAVPAGVPSPALVPTLPKVGDLAAVTVEKPSAPQMPAPATIAPTPAPTAAVTEARERAAKHESEENDTSTSGKGWITRGDIEVNDFDRDWPAIREKIIALGGKAAGNVQLGWLRRTGEAYFHFSIPESNQEELNLFLKTFGPVRFSSERHPRVMPAGQIRIILTVKDGNSNEGSATTP